MKVNESTSSSQDAPHAVQVTVKCHYCTFFSFSLKGVSETYKKMTKVSTQCNNSVVLFLVFASEQQLGGRGFTSSFSPTNLLQSLKKWDFVKGLLTSNILPAVEVFLTFG